MRAEQAAAFLGMTRESRKSSASCSGEACACWGMATATVIVNAKASEILCTGWRCPVLVKVWHERQPGRRKRHSLRENASVELHEARTVEPRAQGVFLIPGGRQ